MTYTYNKQVNPSVLFNQIIENLGIEPAKIIADNNVVNILFDFTLSSGVELSLDTLVNSHVYTLIEEETVTYFFHDLLSTNLGFTFKGINVSSSGNNRFIFTLPKNISRVTDASLVCIPITRMDTSLKSFTFNLEAGYVGSLFNLYISSLNKQFQLPNTNDIGKLNITELFSSINFNILTEDLIAGVRVTHNTIGGNILYQAITVKYISK